MRKALIFGATGLTGSELLKLLGQVNYYDEITCFVRKEISTAGGKAKIIVTDFNDLAAHGIKFKDADIYCCLGTTIKKVNYNKEAFKNVDLYLPLKIAQIASDFGANQFLVISALGANADSRIFYNRVKGELQEKLTEMNIPIHIFQPSILVGERIKPRTGEKISAIVTKGFSFILAGPLKKYRAIKARDVVSAMFKTACLNKPGYHIYPSDIIKRIADG
ncbi:MAG: hypothetical protein ACHQFW_06730 [Chitinophagales bacterium]